MLNRASLLRSPLLLCMRQRFGASHGHDDHHHHVELDKNATWVKFKTERRLQCVDGLEDTHAPLPQISQADPYAHVRGKPWYSVDNFFYGQAFFHPTEHEEHAATRQGYMYPHEPVDPRFDEIPPFFLALFTIVGLMFVSSWTNPRFLDPISVTVNEADVIESMVDARLRQKADKIRSLEAELGI